MPACPELMSTPVCAFAGSPRYLPAARVGSHGTIHVHGNRIRSSEPCYENKMKIRLALRILWGLCCLLLLLVNTGDYVQFTKHPELYPIGGEGLGLRVSRKLCPCLPVGDSLGHYRDNCVLLSSVPVQRKNPADTCCFDAAHVSLSPDLHDHLWDIECCFIAPVG